MAFDFLNRIASKVSATVSSLVQRAESAFGSTRSSSGASEFTASSSGFSKTVGRLEGLADSFKEKIVPQIVINEIARETRDTMRELIEPISRTGNLKRSIEWQELGEGEAAVVSDSDYIDDIEEGDFDVPEIEELLEWMDNKEEFSGKSFKEKRRISFAIQNSIKNKKGEGRSGKSTLRQLSPTGDRRYPFIDMAVDRMGPKIQGVGDIIATVVRNS